MHHSICWSGGKDSTASIILAHLNNEPIDSIVFVEVMYDNERNISGENPEHIKFIKEVAKPLFESWGYKVYVLKSKTDYLTYFNSIVKHPRKILENKGKRRGFPICKLCGIKRECKLRPMQDFYKQIGKTIQYVGIACDEPKRLNSLHNQPNRVSLLEKYGYTEQMAYDLCSKYNLLSPMYDYSKRGGCWFCSNAKLEEQKVFKENYPSIWNEFVALEKEENLANDRFDSYKKKTLSKINEMLENEQPTLFDFTEEEKKW